MPLVNFEQLSGQYAEEDFDRICEDHERLVEVILEEEEDLIGSHRHHIDDVVDLVKQEMVLLHDVDKPGSDIEQYVGHLDAILLHKMDLIASVRARLIDFYSHLKLEENLQRLYVQRGGGSSEGGGAGNGEGGLGQDENLMMMDSDMALVDEF